MKKIITVLATLLIGTFAFAKAYINQGAAFVHQANIGYQYNGNFSQLGINNQFADYTEIGYRNNFFKIDGNVILAPKYQDYKAELEARYENDFVTPFVNGNINYVTLTSINDRRLETYNGNIVAGVEVEKEWKFLSCNFKGYAGWTFADGMKFMDYASVNYNNLCTTGFKVTFGITEYIDVYFGIESFQMANNIVNWKPVLVNNTYGVKAHYDFNNHFGVFASWDYNCKHSEVTWSGENLGYNFNRGVATIGVTAKL